MGDTQGNPGILTRFASGVAANAYSQGLTLIIQLVMIPLLLGNWGAELTGEWFILSAIPVYLAMSDLSFGTTAGSQMTMLAARGDYIGALKVVQSAWVLVTAVSAALFLVFLGLTAALPLASILNLHLMSDPEAKAIMVVLLCQVFVAQQGGIIESAYKASGHYARGTFFLSTLRLVEFLIGVGLLLMGADPWLFAMAGLAARGVIYYLLWMDIRRLCDWLYPGFTHCHLDLMKPLWGPAISFNAFPLGYALSIQGFVILVGVSLGPAAAALFNPMRTMSRAVNQLANAIGLTAWVELSRALGRDDYEFARHLHRRVTQIAIWVVGGTILLLALFGGAIFQFWTHGRLVFEPDTFALLLVASLIGSLWGVSYVVALAINRHQKLAVLFIISAGLGLGVGAALIGTLGLKGVVFGIIVTETLMLVATFNTSMHILQDDFKDFLPAVVKPPTDLLAKLWRRIHAS
ncbi:MAG: hypothetical protein KIT11_03650 [Fimbriimonadaceae bacterium]|nr:hypothetical protein [Fimbriimonadaceae bacterium]QYK57008.1 MAG: hypothetical protein KF733_05875 [Fimbriimonadaceae bacterium]